MHWLARPVIGDRLGAEGAVVSALHRRVERRAGGALRLQVAAAQPDAERAIRLGKTRKIRWRARVEPYAPQLVRLVRSPYALATRRGRREKVRERRAPVFVAGGAPRDARAPRISALARREIPMATTGEIGMPRRPRPVFGAMRWARGGEGDLP